ncbi:MAG: flagellar protein FlgN [Nitrospiraceae bacterium]|nr:MAG: flagellar protein FlgN [Nitrospiraceae bacterium]
MTSDIAIINILQEQIKTYKVFHDLLNKERACLVKIDSEKVDEISKVKDTVIMKLRLLEEERQRLIKQYAEVNGIDMDINLDKLGQLTGNTIFHEMRSQLLSLLQSIEEMNKFNSILIDRSLNHIKNNTNFFNLFKKEQNPDSTGVLLSKES